MEQRSEKYLTLGRKVFETEIEALQSLSHELGKNFATAVEWCIETLTQRNKLILTGVGKSGNVCRKIAATLTSTGSVCVLMDSVDAMHGDLGIVNDGDLVFVFSYSGESGELINLLPALKRFSIKIVAVTGNTQSSLAQHSDLVLSVKVHREACPFNLAPTSSSTAMMVMGDALAMTILQARGFTRKDYAKFHPSGAIGRSLLLKVKEIMRTAERHPILLEDCTVKEGILKMTEAKAGSLTIVDEAGKLTGIFSDGDLRRYMAKDEKILERTLKSVMTRNPIVVREEALAAEALRIFNEKNIDDLIVVNDLNEPKGLVDSQDLPKIKMM
jgi:arabinose-5-phosphate isomerase